jgi:hypothetical protein
MRTRTLTLFAATLLVSSVAHAELTVESSEERITPGDTVVIVDTEGSAEALTVTYYPGSRIARDEQLQGEAEPEGQGVRYAFVPVESGLVRVSAGDASTTLMVGYTRAPVTGIIMLSIALLCLGGLSAVGLRNA